MNNTIIILISFSLTFFVDWIIKNNYLGIKINKFYLKFINLSIFRLYLIFFIIILLLLNLLGSFNIEILDYFNINFNNFAGDGVNVNNNVDTKVENINLNHPILQLSVPASAASQLAAAGSFASGAALGIKAAQAVNGTPLIKAATGLGVYGAVQGSTIIMSKILSHNKGHNFIRGLLDNSAAELLNSKYTEFPLNMLVDLNNLVNLEILALIILFNVLTVDLLTTKIDYNKYVPNNKLGNLALFFLNRYIKLWGNSRQFFIICSFIILKLNHIIVRIRVKYNIAIAPNLKKI
uniref:Uncharacterized protein n=1 Tax=Lyophyllum decastes TaxID=64660 RepID=A0A2Z4HH46_LYODE|nr:hypothetical protein [Lyophyllum decastes]AWW14082.1 hypothetical protein [Lyophyllum decastes]